MEDINNSQLPPVQHQPVETPITPPLIQEEPISQNDKKTGIGFYVISIIVILFLISACYVLAFRSKDLLNLVTKKNANLSSSKKTLSDKSISQNSPLKQFISNFSNNSYKITNSGNPGNINLKFSIKKEDWSAVFLVKDKIYYTNNGNVFRLESTTVNGANINKNGTYFRVNYREKTYNRMDLAKQGKLINLTYDDNFLLGRLLKEEQSKKLLWTSMGNNEWVTDWKFEAKREPKSEWITFKMKIFIDPNTNLVNTISLKVNDNDPWQDSFYKYEQISNIDELLTIPSDFKDTTSSTN